ncbi:hypothetical protein ACFPN2_09240 [Steroidobacter flavus]|uniref:HEPN domain-containing protein n=1 Tax=Steroidobacter flavus TaxID=1842136 RepID=A0ABV8SRR7_9GAMM
MVKKANLDNLTKGAKPALHAAEPNWDTLRGLTDRASKALVDARRKTNTLATRFSAAYGAAFWLARASVEAAGYRLAGSEGHRTMVFQCLAHTVEWEAGRWRRLDDIHRLRNRFDYGDIVDVSEAQVETAIADAQALLDDVLKIFPALKPK